MNCVNHPQVAAAGMCTYCGKPFCQECLVEIKDKMYCKEHAGKAVDEAAEKGAATATPIINITNTNANENTNINGGGFAGPAKSKVVALLLCFFFGYLGAHRFYVGKVGTGILYLFTGGLVGIGSLIDFIMILIGSFKDNFGRPLS